jgi:hypothetical protein
MLGADHQLTSDGDMIGRMQVMREVIRRPRQARLFTASYRLVAKR